MDSSLTPVVRVENPASARTPRFRDLPIQLVTQTKASHMVDVILGHEGAIGMPPVIALTKSGAHDLLPPPYCHKEKRSMILHMQLNIQLSADGRYDIVRWM